jgi:GT2 family glycosyltransferase
MGNLGIKMDSTIEAAWPKVSVIVPHYHDLARLDLCLDALERQTYPRARFEIVVADNASPEGEEAVSAVVRGRARLLVVTERGAGPARNGGVAVATGDVLAFTDSDCIPEPAWLEAAVAALREGEVVGGRMRVLAEQVGSPNPVEAFEMVFAFDNEHYVKRLGFTVTANLVCRRDTFDRVGGFRVGVSEDLEWSGRARQAGCRLVYAEDAVVGHPARTSWAELTGKWRRINAETFGLSAGRPGAKIRWLLRSSLLPISAVVHTPRVLQARDLNGWRQKAGALQVLYRLRIWRLLDALRVVGAAAGEH